MSSLGLTPLNQRPGNLTEMVMDAIEDAIVNRALAPGQRVSEATLAEALQVSKTPVREALLRLRFIGLVHMEDRGLRVITPAAGTIRYAYELRSGLERSAATYAAERAGEDQLSAIAEEAQKSLDAARAADSVLFQSADLRFHRSVAGASRNPLLAESHSNAITLTRALRARDVSTPGFSIRCGEEHVDISRAITDRNGELAGRLMHSHIGNVMSAVLSAIEDQAGSKVDA